VHHLEWGLTVLLYGRFAAVHPHKQTGDGTWIFSWLPHAGFKLSNKARANTYVQYTPDSEFELLPKPSSQKKMITAENRKLKDEQREQVQEQCREEERHAKYERGLEHIALLRSAAVSALAHQHDKFGSQHQGRFAKGGKYAVDKYLSQCKFLGIQAVPISPSEYSSA